MVFRVRLMPEAADEAERLYWRLIEQSPMHGQQWYNSLIVALDSLATNPARCPLAPDPALRALRIRHLLYGKKPHIYRILFQISEDQETVEILHIRHGAMKHIE
jgi:toxin ParE1/3/4